MAIKKLKGTLQLEKDRQNKNYIKTLTYIKPPIEALSPLRKADGTWARSAEDKANLFACYLILY